MNDECGWLYQTLDENGKPNGKINCVVWSDVFVCPNCGKEYVFWDASMDYENKCIKDDFIVLIAIQCKQRNHHGLQWKQSMMMR